MTDLRAIVARDFSRLGGTYNAASISQAESDRHDLLELLRECRPFVASYHHGHAFDGPGYDADCCALLAKLEGLD